MLFFYEAKKLIKNRAVAALSLILLAVTAITALRGASNSAEAIIDAGEAKEAYIAFTLDTELAAGTALNASEGAYSSAYYSEVIGKTFSKDVKMGEPLSWEMIERQV